MGQAIGLSWSWGYARGPNYHGTRVFARPRAASEPDQGSAVYTVPFCLDLVLETYRSTCL